MLIINNKCYKTSQKLKAHNSKFKNVSNIENKNLEYFQKGGKLPTRQEQNLQ